MKRRLKIAFHVEDLDLPRGKRIIIGPDQTVVELDDAVFADNEIGPSEASEQMDAAGAVIARYIRLKLAEKLRG